MNTPEPSTWALFAAEVTLFVVWDVLLDLSLIAAQYEENMRCVGWDELLFEKDNVLHYYVKVEWINFSMLIDCLYLQENTLWYQSQEIMTSQKSW